MQTHIVCVLESKELILRDLAFLLQIDLVRKKTYRRTLVLDLEYGVNPASKGIERLSVGYVTA